MDKGFKQISYQLKGLDEAKGIVEAYANVYNIKDDDGDISATGSFNKTIKENFRRIRVLKDHNPTQLLGVPLEINPTDPYGLFTISKFNLQKSLARDMFTDVKLMFDEGLSSELSIGYKVVKRDPRNKAIITEYKLFEYSFLSSWAANKLSTVSGIKSIKDAAGILELIEKAYDLDYSDQRLRDIELILKTLSDEPDQKLTMRRPPLFGRPRRPGRFTGAGVCPNYPLALEATQTEKSFADIINEFKSQLNGEKRIF